MKEIIEEACTTRSLQDYKISSSFLNTNSSNHTTQNHDHPKLFLIFSAPASGEGIGQSMDHKAMLEQTNN